MSRCFPFPPPGYEKKTRIDDADLLTKEKNKEKKHKEKKDKERREGKEKRNGDKSKDKHIGKKERKEKKNREKGKNHTSVDKRVEGKPDQSNGDKLFPNTLQNAETKDSKFVQDFTRRITDEHKTAGSQMARCIAFTDQRRAELSGIVVERNVSEQSNDRDKTMQNKDDNRINGIRNHPDARGLENRVVQHFYGRDEKSIQKNVEEQMDRKEKSEHGEIRVDGRVKYQLFSAEMDKKKVERIDTRIEKITVKEKMDGKEKSQYSVDTKLLGNALVPELFGTDKKRIEQNAKPVEKNVVEKQMDGKDKSKRKDGESKADKRKDRDRENKSKSKDKEKDKAKVKSEPSKDQSKSRGSGNEFLDTGIIEPSPLLGSNKKNAGVGIVGKRKEPDINGYLHDNNGIRPNKLPRHVSSSQPVMENGMLEHCQTAIRSESTMRDLPNNPEVDIKEYWTNGLTEVAQDSACITRLSPASMYVNENGDTPVKRPHPDSKFLDQILSIPKPEELAEFDEQEWLCSSDHQKPKRPNVCSPFTGTTQEVWSKALVIDDADVCALPYVIPY